MAGDAYYVPYFNFLNIIFLITSYENNIELKTSFNLLYGRY